MSAPFVGKRVAVDGTSRADLNGSRGLASDYDRERGRYSVRLDQGITVALKPGNLQPLPESEHTGPRSSPPRAPSSSAPKAGSEPTPGQNKMLTVVLVGIAGMWLFQQFQGGGSGGGPGLWGSGGEDAEYDDRDEKYLSGAVREVVTLDQFRGALSNHAENTGLPVVVDFFSHSCGPCRMIAPTFKRLASEYKGRAVFLTVDVNRNYEAASACNVRGMPTFHFYLNKKTVFQFSGADDNGLRRNTRDIVERAEEAGTFVGQAVSVPDLRAFYEKHDPDKASEAETLAKKYESKTSQLVRVCRQKYGSAPRVSARADAGNASAPTPAGEERPGASGRCQLDACSLEELEAEVQRRRAEKSDADDEADIFEPAARVLESTERLVIIGGGPAGLAAAIYAARAGLKPVVLAPSFGGQLLGKGVDVENYPGVVGEHATGRGIVELMRRQAISFEARLVDAPVLSVDFRSRPFQLQINGSDAPVKASTVILACGADPRWLEVTGEDDFRGRGVSACATCDGFLFREKKVAVVGGGDTAMEDALHLARSSSHVTVFHRRDSFRASKVLADQVLAHPSITVRWNTTVESFHGKDELTQVKVRSMGGKVESVNIAAAFVAIGHVPQTQFVQGQVAMDDMGYVVLGNGTATSVPGVFAAGDVADHTYRQAVTASGTGAMAALDAERFINSER